MSKNMRGYSTDYRDHIGLLHSFARKQFAHVTNLRIPMDYDDVYGELLVAFCQALNGYDASKGITFTAYLGRCCSNHFYTKVLGKHGKKVQVVENGAPVLDEGGEPTYKWVSKMLPVDSIEDLTANSEDGSISFYDVIVDENAPSPEDTVIRKQEILNNLRLLSNDTRRYLMQLLGTGDSVVSDLPRERREVIREELVSVYGIAPLNLR